MSRPQDNPKEHKRMSSDYNDDDSGSDENMAEETQTETDGGSDELNGLNVYVCGSDEYVVGNPESGNAYHVDMDNEEHDGTMTCTCPDYRFRAQEDENRACKHIQAVIAIDDDKRFAKNHADELRLRHEILTDKVDSVTQQLTNISANAHADSGVPSENRSPTDEQYVDAGDAAGNGEEMAAASAQEAADKLQEAFNNVVEGFDVQADDGRVWVNKTPGAPDTLQGPGNVETFQAFLQGPQRMQYDPDGGPGQFFKNYVEPGDVDAYISEVLE